MTFRQIEIFLSVAKTGNVSRSAEELLLSQSAVSMALAELERILGGNLFDRPGRKIFLNDRGRQFMPRALEIRDRMNEAASTLRSSHMDISGHLSIAASSTVGNYLIPGMMSCMVNKFPETSMTLTVSNSEEVIRHVMAFEADVGFIEGYTHEQALDVRKWRSDRMAIVISPGHELARRKKIEPRDLERCDWILRERGSGTRDVFEKAAEGKFEIDTILLELGNTEAIKTAVESGTGISCLSRLSVERAVAGGHLVELHTPWLDLGRDFYVIVHKDKYRSAFLNRFLEFSARG